MNHREISPSGSRSNGPDRGWSWVIAFSCCFINFLLYGLARMSGILLISVVETLKIPRGTAALPFSASTSVRNLSGCFVGYLGQRFGLKPVIATGCVLAALGAGLCFFVNDIVWITVFWGGLFGLGSGLACTLLPVAINQHFRRHRGTASGISYSGSYIGSLVFPPLMVLLLDRYGISGTFLVISGLILNVFAVAMLFREPTWTETEQGADNKSSGANFIKDDRMTKFRRRSLVRKLSEQYPKTEIILKARELDFWNRISPAIVEGKIKDQFLVETQPFSLDTVINFPPHNTDSVSNVKCTRKHSLTSFGPKGSHKVWTSNALALPQKGVLKRRKIGIGYKRNLAVLKRIWKTLFRESSYSLDATKEMQHNDEIKLVSFKISSEFYNYRMFDLKYSLSRNPSSCDSVISYRISDGFNSPVIEEEESEVTDEAGEDQLVVNSEPEIVKVTSELHQNHHTTVNGATLPSVNTKAGSLKLSNASSHNHINKSILSRSIPPYANDANYFAKPRSSLNRRYSQNIAKRVSISPTVSTHIYAAPTETTPELKNEEQTDKSPTVLKSAEDCFFGWLRMFLNPMFVVIGGTQSLYTFVIVCTITIVEDFAKDLNAPRHHLHYAQMVLSTADLLGTLTLGLITDRGYMTRRHFMAACFFGMALSITAISFSTNFTMLLMLVSVYGIFESGVVITFPLLTAQFIKPEKQAVAIASTNTLSAPVVLMVPLVIGHFRDKLGCYTGLFYLLSGISLLCCLVWLLAPYILRKIKAYAVEAEREIDMTQDRLRYMRPSF